MRAHALNRGKSVQRKCRPLNARLSLLRAKDAKRGRSYGARHKLSASSHVAQDGWPAGSFKSAAIVELFVHSAGHRDGVMLPSCNADIDIHQLWTWARIRTLTRQQPKKPESAASRSASANHADITRGIRTRRGSFMASMSLWAMFALVKLGHNVTSTMRTATKRASNTHRRHGVRTVGWLTTRFPPTNAHLLSTYCGDGYTTLLKQRSKPMIVPPFVTQI